MPRATNKTELIAAANSQWDTMWTLIDSVSDGAQSLTFSFEGNPQLKEAHWARDKNMRDVLVHLYEWHLLLLHWVKTNMAGGNQPFLPEPYTWKTYGGMNIGFWDKHQLTTYDEAATLLRDSHAEVLALIESLTDEELFDKKHFPWTGTTHVGAYCISATSSHYEWATKKIKRHIREKKQRLCHNGQTNNPPFHQLRETEALTHVRR